MPFQQTVNRQYTTGFAGELVEDGPKRARPARIAALPVGALATGPNRISRAFGYAADIGTVGMAASITEASRSMEVQVGGKVFYGILGHPKHYALFGSADGSLAPSYDLPNGAEGEFFDMATGLVVEVINHTTAAATVTYGDNVGYVPNDMAVADNPLGLPAGALVTWPGDSGPPPTGIVGIPNARVVNAVSMGASAVGALVAATTIIQLTQ
jgi:hypothetical protein